MSDVSDVDDVGDVSDAANPALPALPALVSPVSVTAGAVLHSADFILPRLLASGRDRVVLYAGVQINGTPHLGTNVTQTAAFLLAQAARERFGVRVLLRFGALDNSPYEVRTCPETGSLYERSFGYVLGEARVGELVGRHYGGLFDELSAATGVPYEVLTYTEQQAGRAFREEFLTSLGLMDTLRRTLAPSTGTVPVNFPCPRCGWAQKHGEQTELLSAGAREALFAAVCLEHGKYLVDVAPGTDAFIGLTTLHRNLLKERVAARDDALPVIVKGADWAPGCRLLDEAFLSYQGALPPPRVFTPVVLSDSGAKLSKTLIRQGTADLSEGTEPWMLDASAWPGSQREYARLLLGLVGRMLGEPRHFERGYTTREVARLIGRRLPGPSGGSG
ncbi:hypothetical protein [Streptomyces sp. NPDC046261]|uniref:hypothetical protein n=1 Tax=Streptomyces sp. NPDC046261 TaxID=3157200 RepID=UPI0033EE95D2